MESGFFVSGDGALPVPKKRGGEKQKVSSALGEKMNAHIP